MSIRQRPPGRTSSATVGLVEPSMPHHSPTYFGSVQMRKTTSGGAAKTRVRVNSAGHSPTSLAGRIELALLDLVDDLFDCVEPAFPEAAVRFQPVADRHQRRQAQLARAALGIPATRDQARLLQDPDMLGDGADGHSERLGEFGHRRLTAREPGQDSAAGWVGESGEGRAEVIAHT